MSPRSSAQNELIREERAQQIKDAALRLFAEQGFMATSISQIAQEAGISKGLMYSYFDNKEALLQAIIADAMQLGETIMGQNLRADMEPAEQLRGLINSIFDFLKGNAAYWRLITALAFQPKALEGVESMVKAKTEKSLAMGQHLFEQLGYEDPQMETYFFGCLLDGVVMQYVSIEQEYPLESLRKFILKKYAL